jgi:5-methylcytosine-specific restriction enzyme subunit McrC
MRRLTLREYRREPAVELSVAERDAIRDAVRGLVVEPAPGSSDRYDLTPGSYVGGVTVLDRIAVEIEPKFAAARVVFMISYALDPTAFHQREFRFSEADSLVEAVILAFDSHLQRAFARGVLAGYLTTEEVLPVVRGRVRFDDQLRWRYGRFPPVEVRFDDFTENTLENRLIRAAIARLRRLTLRLGSSALILSHYEALLERVPAVEFTRVGVPDVSYTRLNAHYRGAVEMARLILQSTAFDVGHGTVRASAFLLDMNRVFENFIVAALREELGLKSASFRQGGRTGFYLDTSGQIGLKPDISWWDGPLCSFVGDLKYKKATSNVEGAIGPDADLYQLLAYTTAAGLSSGMLIYAAGERQAGNFDVVDGRAVLKVRTVDVNDEPRDLLRRLRQIAGEVRTDRRTALLRRAAVA